MAHQWDAVNNIPSGITPDTMVLLSDGDVLVLDSVSGNGGKNWYRLHPNDQDDYANGTWSGPFAMTNTRQFFASGILRDGRFFAIGGEDSDAGNDTPLGEIFDPTTNTWSAISKPSAFDFIAGDIAACILADGRVILGSLTDSRTALWDPVTDDWREAGLAFGTLSTPTKQGDTNEETWTLLPDGTVVTVNINGVSHAEKYVPATDTWVSASAPPQVLALMSLNDTTVNPPVPVNISEMGPAVVIPDGRLFAVGATGHTAFYTPPANPADAGTWTAGPDFPADTSNNHFNDPNGNLQTAIDAPGVLLPCGKVLCVAGNTVREVNNGQTQFWSNPLRVYVFDPGANSLTLLSPQPPNNSVDTWEGRFLLLPNGRVLLSTEHSGIQQLTVDASLLGQPDAGSKPAIGGFPSVLVTGHTYTISGTQFNGKSQACSYGDDAQMATNYPIVRLTNISNSKVRYLRSFNFSTLGIATGGATVTAAITVPGNVPIGQYNMQVIANGIESDPVAVQVATEDCFFIVDRSTFAQGEIQALIHLNGTPAVIDPAFYVVVEGFRPSELGITAANLANPPNTPNVPSPASGITIAFSGPVIPEDPSLPDSPQRFTFPYSVSFANGDSTPGGIFDFPNPSDTLTLNATLTAAGNTVTSSAQIQLIKNPNPYILHGDTANGQPWYLSVDIRVFQMKQGQTKFAVTVGTGQAQNVATAFIQQVITNLNGSSSAGSLFDALPTQEDAASLALSPVDVSNVPVYNFAVARVRLRDITAAANVRLFFRMWAAQQTNATYDTSTLYRSSASGSNKIPLLGVVGDEIVTIPFFATPRVDSSTVSMTTQAPDTPNIHTLNPDPLGGETDAYYGCWLDINQPNQLLFPVRMVGGSPANIPDGPFTGMGALLPIQQLVRSEHQCLLAEVSFDPDPIPGGADPSNSDKLAQRNLAFVNVPNPGVDPSRVAPQPFEVRTSPAVLLSDNRPDELMVLWGNTPSGTLANFYLPAANASDIMDWARKLYTTHRITALDAHTLQVPAAGVTYLPLPQGSTVNFAGLLSMGLPAGVTKGDQYIVAVRQLTSAESAPVIIIEARAGNAAKDAQQFTWRRSLGAFQLNIPVGTKQTLLEGESRRLSVMRWIQSKIDHSSRWFPVSQRYLDQLAGRVQGMGGDPSKVAPSPTGDWYRPPDGHGSLVVTFADSHGNPIDATVDVFLKHNVLSDARMIRGWNTLDTLAVRGLISTDTGIYELQAIGDQKLAGGRFVTIEDGGTTVVQLELERK